MHPFYAMVLGLMVAFNPCQIAICISAIVANNTDKINIQSRTNAFAAGRASMYFLLGFLILLVYHFTDKQIFDFSDSKFVRIVDEVLPYFCLAAGLFFMLRVIVKHHNHDNCHNSNHIIKRNNVFGPFVLGCVLALVFCPESAVLFFAFLIPLAIASPIGLINIVVFAFSAVTPIVVVARICGRSKLKVNEMELRMEKVQLYINLIAALILLSIGIVLFAI